jgi:hypothetical protein
MPSGLAALAGFKDRGPIRADEAMNVLQGAGGQRRDLKSLRLDRTGKNQTGLCRIDEPEGPVVIR